MNIASSWKNLCNESTLPYYEHPQVPLLIDTLNRYEKNHLLLVGTASEKINLALIKSTLAQLSTHPHANLKDAHFFYYDMNLSQSLDELTTMHTPAVLVINLLKILSNNPLISIQPFLLNKNWRLIILTNAAHYQENLAQLATISSFFSVIHLSEPTEPALIALLKAYSTNLENHHQLTIPEETIATALILASRYLQSHSTFDTAFELLDRAAARVRLLSNMDTLNDNLKPVVTPHLLAKIIAELTNVPMQHIENNPFQTAHFIQAMQQTVFGQDSTLALVSSALQQSYLKLHETKGPLCSFIFAGLTDTGKTEFANRMSHYLLGSNKALLQVHLDKEMTCLADIKVIGDNSSTLLEAIHKMPYAILLIDDIESEHIPVLSLFKEVFMRGYLFRQGIQYDFRHTIIIMTTQIGAESLNELLQHHPEYNKAQTPNLLQLVLNENVLDIPEHIKPAHSNQELYDILFPCLEQHFPSFVLQKTHIAPFIPLEFSALEKIIRIRMKLLGKNLTSRFGIELTHPPEIIKFLAHEAYWRPTNQSLDQLLEQLLYAKISHELLDHNNQRANRLLLQLHENGHALKCELTVDTTMHNS